MILFLAFVSWNNFGLINSFLVRMKPDDLPILKKRTVAVTQYIKSNQIYIKNINIFLFPPSKKKMLFRNESG